MLNFECSILNVEVKSTAWLVRCAGHFTSIFSLRHLIFDIR